MLSTVDRQIAGQLLTKGKAFKGIYTDRTSDPTADRRRNDRTGYTRLLPEQTLTFYMNPSVVRSVGGG